MSSSDTHDDAASAAGTRSSTTSCTSSPPDAVYTYEITGTAAHSRIAPLLPSHWVDVSPYVTSNNDTKIPSPSSSPADAPAPAHTVSFLWSNASNRLSTKPYRDYVKVYSHLPNGTAILDDKWVLARLLPGNSGAHESESSTTSSTSKSKSEEGDAVVVGLETHCFRGPDGFANFCRRVGMFHEESSDAKNVENDPDGTNKCYRFPELMECDGSDDADILPPPPEPSNLWVIKDAQCNGAGGIWVVDPSNASSFLPPPLHVSSAAKSDTGTSNENYADNASTGNASNETNMTPLIDGHRYVVQRYAWPPMLYYGRKFHIRVYGLISADGRAYVHRKCFLHVANEKFDYGGTNVATEENTKEGVGCVGSTAGSGGSGSGSFEPSVHITNCCANSHDEDKFSGEICADLGVMPGDVIEDTDNDTSEGDVALGEYFPSISETVATLARKSMPYLTGGLGNGGFEYLGLDFILSTEPTKTSDGSMTFKPTAHLLEVNAPPSQDTATGLPHAEELHDAVLRDLLTLWVIPKVDCTTTSNPVGWKCVYNDVNEASVPTKQSDCCSDILPSKAAILSKMRWSIFEWKMAKQYEQEGKKLAAERLLCPDDAERLHHKDLSDFVRWSFPYYSNGQETIFLENAGGAQVPASVIRAMNASLANRHRACEGSRAKLAARSTLLSILGARPESHRMILGSNATSLLDSLAQKYVISGYLGQGDEIIICTENHSANIEPWVRAASSVGAKIIWWQWERDGLSDDLSNLVTDKTRIVAVSHASNIVGELRDIQHICEVTKEKSRGRAHVVVDGVAAAPHVFPALAECGAHWYAISCHKLFGPHLGGLCGLRLATDIFIDASEDNVAASIRVDGDERFYKSWEVGTQNYEACAGVGYGLKEYFASLASFSHKNSVKSNANTTPASVSDAGISSDVSMDAATARNEQTSYESTEEARQGRASSSAALLPEHVSGAYQRIAKLEEDICACIINWLRESPQVILIGADCHLGRIPVISFFHRHIDSDTIAQHCLENNIVCRSDTFLASSQLLKQLALLGLNGKIVRLSFAHYNLKDDAQAVVNVFKTIKGW